MANWSYTFCLEDYQRERYNGKFRAPSVLRPLYEGKMPDKVTKYKVTSAFFELKKRLGPEYFKKVKKHQTDALDYASQTFPAYRLLLEDLLADDWMAMMDWRNFGRDHVVHQPLSAYVATCFLKGSVKKNEFTFHGKNIIEHIYWQVMHSGGCKYLHHQIRKCKATRGILADSSVTRLKWSAMIEVSTYVAALFHDCGYPWSFKSRIGDALDNLQLMLIGKNSGKSLTRSHKSSLLMAPFNNYLTTNTVPKNKVEELVSVAINKTHGAPGAVALLEMNKGKNNEICKHRDPMKLFSVEWAALATMMHDMADVYWGSKKNVISGQPDEKSLRLKFDVDPLSCLITLCDLIQEFGRYQASFTGTKTGQNTVPLIDYISPCVATRVEWNEEEKKLSIIYLYDRESDMLSKKSFLINDQRKLCDPTYGFLDLSALGVNQIYLRAEMKQR